MVTAIIPVYNAAGHIREKLDSLLEQDYPADKLEIIVCSDGSDDGSDEIVRAYAEKDDRVRLLRSEQRKGKPNAVNLMREAARGDVLLMTDIRQPLGREAVSALVEKLSDPRVGCVSGNLTLRGEAGAGVYWKYENFIRRSEARFRSMIGVTGPIYVIRKEDLGPVPPDIILDDVWIPTQLRLRHRLLLFSEKAVAYDDAFTDQREFGRKVRTLAGNYQLLSRLPRLLIPFLNPSFFETFSHRVLRLVCPWALVTLLVASLWNLILSPHPAGAGATVLTWILVVGQLLVYAAAIIGPRAGRLTSVARTFVVLNWAAVVGLYRFLRGSQRVTW